MKSPLSLSPAVAVAFLLLIQGGPASAASVTLVAAKDNTLIEKADGSLSLGLAPAVFAGRVSAQGGGTIRRALLQFDVASTISEAATITSATLTVQCTGSNGGAQTMLLKRILTNWGEGTSTDMGGGGAPATLNDATWLHTFWPNQFWSTPGGDLARVASASNVMSVIGPASWSSTAMASDVQSWLDAPETNFGWAITGNESVIQTVKSMVSKDGPNQATRPKLTITFSIAGDVNDDGQVNGADLGLLLAAWDTAEPVADLNGDGTVDGDDLGLLLANWT